MCECLCVCMCVRVCIYAMYQRSVYLIKIAVSSIKRSLSFIEYDSWSVATRDIRGTLKYADVDVFLEGFECLKGGFEC